MLHEVLTRDLEDDQLVEALRDAARLVERANAAGGPRLVQTRYHEQPRGRSDIADRQLARARSWRLVVAQIEPTKASEALRLYTEVADGVPRYPTLRSLEPVLGVTNAMIGRRIKRGLLEFRKVLARIEGTVRLDHIEAVIVRGEDFAA